MLRKIVGEFREVVHIRGFVQPIEDVNDMQAVIAASQGKM